MKILSQSYNLEVLVYREARHCTLMVHSANFMVLMTRRGTLTSLSRSFCSNIQ